jgi:hypothetical protein
MNRDPSPLDGNRSSSSGYVSFEADAAADIAHDGVALAVIEQRGCADREGICALEIAIAGSERKFAARLQRRHRSGRERDSSASTRFDPVV